ncbi:MAG: hypothetical protein ACXIVG_10260 [Pararhodobacter sp.]
MGPIQSLHELKSWLRRRARLIVLIMVLGAVAGVFAASRTERVYSATAVLQVINPIIAGEGGAIGPSSALRRVQIIEQRLMTRENLLALADRHGLFTDLPLTQNELVAAMRASVRIESITAAQGGAMTARDGSLSAIIISAHLDEPFLAATVANELAEALVLESSAAAQAGIQRALLFFQQEESRLMQEIAELETQIMDFRTENEAVMPSSLLIRREELGRLEDGLLRIERELSQMRAERSVLEADSGRALSRRRIAELDDLIAQRAAEEVLVAERVATLESLMQRAPAAERELGSLQRRMEQLQSQLSAAAQARREAEIGQRIEMDQQSERFVMLEAATPPDYPESRSRRVVAMLGVVAGLLGGLGLAYVIEAMHPVLRTADRMERELQLRPAISIPLNSPPLERRRRRLIWGFGLLILLGAAAALTLQLTGG